MFVLIFVLDIDTTYEILDITLSNNDVMTELCTSVYWVLNLALLKIFNAMESPWHPKYIYDIQGPMTSILHNGDAAATFMSTIWIVTLISR